LNALKLDSIVPLLLVALALYFAPSMGNFKSKLKNVKQPPEVTLPEATLEAMSLRVTLGAGCYWGTEAYAAKKWGKQGGSKPRVVSSAVGFMGGGTTGDRAPSYEEVCRGNTGHVEVLDLTLADDPINGRAAQYEELLRYFFSFHDPTTPDRQGNDAGSQYASAVFVHDEAQRAVAEKVKAELQALVTSKKITAYYGPKVVTAIRPASTFYPAHESHQDYLSKNPGGYCNHRIRFKAWPAS